MAEKEDAIKGAEDNVADKKSEEDAAKVKAEKAKTKPEEKTKDAEAVKEKKTENAEEKVKEVKKEEKSEEAAQAFINQQRLPGEPLTFVSPYTAGLAQSYDAPETWSGPFAGILDRPSPPFFNEPPYSETSPSAAGFLHTRHHNMPHMRETPRYYHDVI